MPRIREATMEDHQALGLITVTASHSAFIGVIPEEDLDFSWTPEVSADNWHMSFPENTDRGQVFLVAEADDRVTGFAWGRPWAATEGFDATVQALYVLPTFHGQGIGRRLLSEVCSRLAHRGATSLEIGCVQENPSCGFYRHLGGVEIGRREVRVDRYRTHEILFGWRDLEVLIEP
ncbi:MAG: GNAT family N-acetyltransferase [Pseudomonadales bacterium]|nr:GNAT family N-acetyltransferase [Pseudomonadales bacterium]